MEEEERINPLVPTENVRINNYFMAKLITIPYILQKITTEIEIKTFSLIQFLHN